MFQTEVWHVCLVWVDGERAFVSLNSSSLTLYQFAPGTLMVPFWPDCHYAAGLLMNCEVLCFIFMFVLSCCSFHRCSSSSFCVVSLGKATFSEKTRNEF